MKFPGRFNAETIAKFGKGNVDLVRENAPNVWLTKWIARVENGKITQIIACDVLFVKTYADDPSLVDVTGLNVQVGDKWPQ